MQGTQAGLSFSKKTFKDALRETRSTRSASKIAQMMNGGPGNAEDDMQPECCLTMRGDSSPRCYLTGTPTSAFSLTAEREGMRLAISQYIPRSLAILRNCSKSTGFCR